LAIRLRRFLITEPMWRAYPCLVRDPDAGHANGPDGCLSRPR
jgi:hypothetical protein